jgi:hypothetical protein
VDKKKKLKIAKFIKFVTSQLGIKNPFKVQFAIDRDESMKTYAFYDTANGIIKVYIKGRGLADVLRSIAHEFVHHRQNQDNKIKPVNQDIGGEIEDEANAKAGALVKRFGYENPDFKIYSE